MNYLMGGLRRYGTHVNKSLCGMSISALREKARGGSMWLSSKATTGKTYFGDKLVDENEKTNLGKKAQR